MENMKMDKTEAIGRKILGWKLNSSDRWYDHDNDTYIHVSDFQPEQNYDHAMLIVEKLKSAGFTYETDGEKVVTFNDTMATGDTLPQAITNAAHTLIENNLVIV